jgi:hypothetical protein
VLDVSISLDFADIDVAILISNAAESEIVCLKRSRRVFERAQLRSQFLDGRAGRRMLLVVLLNLLLDHLFQL